MTLTDDRNHPGVNKPRGDGQNEAYLVLSEEERAKGFVRPVRTAYKHDTCGVVTTMALPLCETYARDPRFYGATFCMGCKKHLPVGRDGEFVWINRDGRDGERVGFVFHAGDSVHHHPTGEDWILATDEESGEVFACGSPETLAKASDLTLINAGDDEARTTTLRQAATSGGARGAKALAQLGRECGSA